MRKLMLLATGLAITSHMAAAGDDGGSVADPPPETEASPGTVDAAVEGGESEAPAKEAPAVPGTPNRFSCGHPVEVNEGEQQRVFGVDFTAWKNPKGNLVLVVDNLDPEIAGPMMEAGRLAIMEPQG